MIQKETFTSIRGMSFYTCNYSEDVKQFPKIPEELKTSGRVSQNEALDYIMKLYTKQMRDPSKVQLIVGWVLVKKEYQDSVHALSQELLDREKVSVIKYSEYASIYLLHPSMIKRDLIKKLNWKVRTPEGQPETKAPLLFVLYMRGSSLPGMIPSVIEPELIGAPQPLAEDDESPRKLESEDKGAMSPITSDEEENNNNKEEEDVGEEQILVGGDQFGDLIDLIEADPDLQVTRPEESITPRSHNASMLEFGGGGVGHQQEPERKESNDSIEITQDLMGIVEEMTPIRDDVEDTAIEEEKGDESKLNFNQEHQLIVDKLQKMSKDELQNFVASATEEEKEKIIKILNSFVEEDPKDQEASVEGDSAQKGVPAIGQQQLHQQYQQFPQQMPHGFGMQGPYGQQPFYQQGMIYPGQQQYQQGRPYQQGMGMGMQPQGQGQGQGQAYQQNYYGNQYKNPGNASGGSFQGSQSRGGYQQGYSGGRGGSQQQQQQSGMSGRGGSHQKRGGYHGSGSGDRGDRGDSGERQRGYHGTGGHHHSRHQGYDAGNTGGGEYSKTRGSRFSNAPPGRQDNQYSYGGGARDQGGYDRYAGSNTGGQNQDQGQGQQRQRDNY